MKQISRNGFLKGCVRSGALAGIVGLCAVLASREELFECSDRCGGCPKLKDSKCSLGLK